MSYRTRIAALVVASAAAIGWAAPAQAVNSGDDTPGYVSAYEFQHLARGTMSDTEHELGVVGAGKVIWSGEHGKHVIKAYPYGSRYICTGSQAQITYDRNAKGQYMADAVVLFIYMPDPMSKATCKPRRH